jgi:hypothetical protein
MYLKPNFKWVALTDTITAVRYVGRSLYSKRDGTYLEYDLNASGLHSWNMANRAIQKAIKQGLITDALEQNARCVVPYAPRPRPHI